jgi:aminoglycoside phosphotransferase (APT) family kinase protein
MEFTPITRPADDFQQGISAEEITAVCRHYFGTQTQVISARELGSGLFNSTYLITLVNEQQVILRVSPHPQAAVFTHEQHLLRREQALEPYLRTVGHFIPHTLAADFNRQLLDRDFVFQTFLPGEIWDEVQGELTEADQTALWCQLAAIAKQIHAMKGSCFGFPDGQPSFERWRTAVAHITHIMRRDLAARQLDQPQTQIFADQLQAGAALLDTVAEPQLLHGDLWPKNVLIDRRQSPPQIVGLLDAERGIWGDPLAEWIFYYLDVPAAFWEVYGRLPTDSATQFRQLTYRGLYTIQILLEATRFNWKLDDFWHTLDQVNREMESILKS